MSAQFGRNPPLFGVNFQRLCETTLLCQGTISETPDIDFAHHVLSHKVPTLQYWNRHDAGNEMA